MAELPPTPDIRLPTSDRSNFLRLVRYIQLIGSLAAMFMGMIFGFDYAFRGGYIGFVLFGVSMFQLVCGCGAGQAFNNYDNRFRWLIIILNATWIICYLLMLEPMTHIYPFEVVLMYAALPTIFLLIPLITLLLPNIRKKFF